MNCPLCKNEKNVLFEKAAARNFFQCENCNLVFVPDEELVSIDDEKTRYEFHHNSIDDAGYRNFLNRLCSAVVERIPAGAEGLDFGCGPESSLSVLFNEAGFQCADYDLFFRNDPAALNRQYDFLTCSETIEHFRNPKAELERFLKIVKPGGRIGIMTQLYDEAPAAFADWFYIRDPTHIRFFSRRTLEWLTEQYSLSAEFLPDGIVVFKNRG